MAKTFCAHALLIARYGYTAAVVFEKVWFLIYQAENAADYNTEDNTGIIWRRFELPRLMARFEAVAPDGSIVSVVGTERSLRRAIDELATAGLFIRKRRQAGFDLRIDFDALRSVVGEDEHYGLEPTPETECPKMDKPNQPPIPEMPNLDKQLPDTLPNVQNLTNSVSINGQSEMPNLDTPYIYIEDSLKEDSQLPTTTPTSVGDAGALPAAETPPQEIPEKIVSMRNMIFGYWQRLTYGDATPDKDQKNAIGNAIDFMRRGHGEELVYDALEQGRFEAWLLLTDDWFVGGKIEKPSQLQGSFNRMVGYEKKNGRGWLDTLTSKVPNWRELPRSQYSKLRKAMPEIAKPVKEGATKTSKQLAEWQTKPYGDSPTEAVTPEDIAEFRRRMREGF